MIVYGVWFGGESYSYGMVGEDTEIFSSLRHAKDVLRERYESNGTLCCDTYYVNRGNEPTLFPCVTRSSYIDLFSGDDLYARIVFGPRGGVKIEV